MLISRFKAVEYVNSHEAYYAPPTHVPSERPAHPGKENMSGRDSWQDCWGIVSHVLSCFNYQPVMRGSRFGQVGWVCFKIICPLDPIYFLSCIPVFFLCTIHHQNFYNITQIMECCPFRSNVIDRKFWISSLKCHHFWTHNYIGLDKIFIKLGRW